MFSEGGNEGWERFRKRQGKTLRKVLSKARKLEKNKSKQVKRFGNVEVEEGMGAAYMPKAGTQGVPEREVTSKAVKKQLNRNRNRAQMKGDLETPSIRYTHSRDKSTDYIRPVKKKRIHKKKVKEAYPAGAEADMNRMANKEKNTWWKSQDKAKVAADKKKKEMQKEGITTGLMIAKSTAAKTAAAAAGKAAAKAVAVKAAPYVAGAAAAYGATKLAQKKLRDRKQQKMVNKAADAAVAKYKSSQENQQENIIAFPMARRAAQLTPQQKRKANADYKQKARDEIKNKMKKESFGNRGISLQELGDPDKMNQLFRMGLAKKGELQLMQRMMKRGPDALKDPKLRQKMYDLLVDLTDLVTKDGQTFVKVRQNVQRNKKDLQAVKELLYYGGQAILEVNTAYKLINIPEDMSGMSVSSGHKRSVDSGAGMTQKGVAAYRRRNPGSKLKTAVTTPPSKLKKGSKAAKRRKAFCSRSRSWTGERGKAARRRWNC